MLETQVEPRAVRQVVSLQSFVHFMASFLWSMTGQKSVDNEFVFNLSRYYPDLFNM